MRRRLTKKQREKWSLIGGISGFLVAGYLIFIEKTNLGFIPLAMAVIILVFRRRNG